MNARQLLAVVTLFAVLVVAFTNEAGACPGGCCVSRMTLAEQSVLADVVLLAERVSGDEQAKQTFFVIRQFLRGEPEELNVGDMVSVSRFVKKDHFGQHLLLGNKAQQGLWAWGSLGVMTEAALSYILDAPSPQFAPPQRLPYFLRFLESSDSLIAEDAFFELESAEWNDLLACTSQLPRDKLREWLRNPNIEPKRLGLYAMLLGICGNRSDAEFLLAHIQQPTDYFRLGIEGFHIGYLWRMGEKGLAVLEKHRLCQKKLPFSERYAVFQAVRFMVAHGQDRLSRDRACESLHLLLEEPELADLVINDLARWEDWSVQDRLMSLYGQGEYDNRPTKRAIVRYLLKAAKVQPPKADEQKQDDPTAKNSKPEDLASSALQAQASLETLREKDPKTVQEAERFFLLLQ